MVTALTIAGSDSSGGAGIQADIKTMTVHGVYAMSAITALTAQNTTGVSGIYEVSPEFLAKQLDSIFTDIPPHAVKVGMVSSAELVQVIAQKLREYGAKKIVVDPVMVSTSGSRLISEDAVETLGRELFPIADLLTPNIPEAEVLTGMSIRTPEEGIRSTVPTIFSGRNRATAGSTASASKTQIPTEQDAPCPVRLQAIWQRG